ncbi:hypothetical protein PC129_g17942 [Phytophthora cactorum]|uniref:Uncharacterized protein n=1 Tax=Phytophthora cactorum TaxID=29920 RepID=A0A8T1HF19_9STRA|nr:hypothetical protein PC112_g19225 [Phytophthora cactorum]KAG2886090.1 hypothetical protein PC114_g19446 [Phytophthora cactorum]KAG3211064.1 hypothetical protein PC129_g17942 [Phytophthora cactorum]
MAPTTRSKLQPPKGSKKASTLAKGKKAGRPKLHRVRTCRFCHRKLKTPQGLLKHLSKKNKCDQKSVAARAEARKLARRLVSKAYYIRKTNDISLEASVCH